MRIATAAPPPPRQRSRNSWTAGGYSKRGNALHSLQMGSWACAQRSRCACPGQQEAQFPCSLCSLSTQSARRVIYLSSSLPVSGMADEPYYGRSLKESKRRSLQGTLLMLRALRYIRSHYPFWNSSGGVDHVWMMLHDEGPCLCPKEIRPSILLSHYGYYANPPKAWTT